MPTESLEISSLYTVGKPAMIDTSLHSVLTVPVALDHEPAMMNFRKKTVQGTIVRQPPDDQASFELGLGLKPKFSNATRMNKCW
jgi:hypothetical protein